jgi:hypothetical protein
MDDSAQQNRTARQELATHERLVLAALLTAANLFIRVVGALEHGRK